MSRKWKAALLGIATAAFFMTTGFVKPNQGYLKSATYYSDDWMVNFWNSESDNMDAELQQIANDGFNSIILAVPWREFQPESGSFNSYAINRLNLVMDKAAAHGLSVMLRVGYTWDYYPEGKAATTRVDELPFNQRTRNQWYEYVGRIYQEASAHPNFAGGFTTWEDFWTFNTTAAAYGKNAKSIKLAKDSGFTDYVMSHYTMDEIRSAFGDSSISEDSIYFPSTASNARKFFYDWYDEFLMGLIADSHQFFPDLSFELRLDGDSIMKNGGGTEWYTHDKSFSSLTSSYASAMYSIPMFTEGSQISAAQALDGTRQALNFARRSGKNVYVEQLLFTDNTPGYENTTKLNPSEQPAYLLSLAPILSELTNGYGIWTYRDYGNNKLYNAQFALDTKGWDFKDGAKVEVRDGSHVARLPKGSSIFQSLQASSGAQNGQNTTVRFQLDGQGRVSVKANGQTHVFTANGEKSMQVYTFSGRSGYIEFSCTEGYVFIDNVNAYNFVTEGHLYHLNGGEDYCISAIRTLNSQLG